MWFPFEFELFVLGDDEMEEQKQAVTEFVESRVCFASATPCHILL